MPLFIPQQTRSARIYKTRKTLEQLSDFEIRQHCGIPAWGAYQLIDLYEPIAETVCPAVPLDTKVLVFLSQLRSGSFQWVAGAGCGVSQPTASRIIDGLCRHTLSIAKSVIDFPSSILEVNKVKQEFYDIARVPNVLGVLDGTHVPIISPAENEPAFVNRKQYHSINCQVIAAKNYKIFDIVAKWPGSTHDSFIWKDSSARTRLYEREFGDSLFIGNLLYWS